MGLEVQLGVASAGVPVQTSEGHPVTPSMRRCWYTTSSPKGKLLSAQRSLEAGMTNHLGFVAFIYLDRL